MKLANKEAICGCLIAIVAVASLSAIGATLFRSKSIKDRCGKCSADVVQQINALGESLEPGGTGVVDVPASDADELILLPAYCNEEDLRRRFSDRPLSFVASLLSNTNNDRVCRLIWVRDGKIISVNSADFRVGMNLPGAQAWKLDERR